MKTWEDYLDLPYRMEIVEDTDEGARLKDQIADLKKLLAAYADGSVKEQA